MRKPIMKRQQIWMLPIEQKGGAKGAVRKYNIVRRVKEEPSRCGIKWKSKDEIGLSQVKR